MYAWSPPESMNLTRGKKIYIFSFLALLILSVVFWNGIKSYERSVINSITGPTLPVFPTPTEKPSAKLSQPVSTATPVQLPEQVEVIEREPKCNGPEKMLVLVVGADNDVGYYRGLSDVMQVYKINFMTAEVDVLSIPRHIWVDIPGLEKQEIFEGKLNQPYFYGNLYELEGGGSTLLARTLYESFGLSVDHYFAINMYAFTNVIDQLGGIDFYNPQYASDGNYYYPEGDIHLNGEDALKFSRIRKFDGVFARMDRQFLVVKAIAQKILTPQYFLQIPSLINSNLDQIVTSLGEIEFEMLLCIATQVDLAEVDNYSIGLDFGEHAWAFPSWAEAGTQILVVDFEKTRVYIKEFVDRE